MKERADMVERLLAKRDELFLSNLEWASLTRKCGAPVSYQTIRRMENEGAIPRHSTLRRLEAALDKEEEDRIERSGGTVAPVAA